MGNSVKSAQPCRITTIIFINIQSTNYPLKPQPGDLPIFKYMTMLSNMFPAQEHFQGCAGYVASQNHQLNVLPCTGQGLGLPFEGDICLLCKFSSSKNYEVIFFLDVSLLLM